MNAIINRTPANTATLNGVLTTKKEESEGTDPVKFGANNTSVPGIGTNVFSLGSSFFDFHNWARIVAVTLLGTLTVALLLKKAATSL